MKTKYDTYKSGLEKKIPDTSGLIEKLVYNAKITDKENKIPNITGVTTNSVLTAEKRADYNKNYWNWEETDWS